jgi:propanol-preferring alcohol dehydrogenase
MRAWILEKKGSLPELKEVPTPKITENEILIAVDACALCRTDLHILANELKEPKLPLILGHQIVGHVIEKGKKVTQFKVGDPIGVPWLARTCGKCSYCLSERENLCDTPLFTGYTRDGGFAEYCVADAQFSFPLPPTFSDYKAAPLLCAGMIGYRALRLTEGAKKVGFYGFGSAAHLLLQVINYKGGSTYVFTRPGDQPRQKAALELGATWAGNSDQLPPTPLDAAIIFAPVGSLYPQALLAVRKGGIVVSAGIHMSDIPAFPYSHLWEERMMRSVANLTRQDGEEFLDLAPKIPITTSITTYPFTDLHTAIHDVKEGKIDGTAVLMIKS